MQHRSSASAYTRAVFAGVLSFVTPLASPTRAAPEVEPPSAPEAPTAAPPESAPGARPVLAPAATGATATSLWDELGTSLGYGRRDGATYSSEGLATRIRWQPLEHFGLDLTGDFLLTEGAGAKSLDVPVGFHLYVPFDLGWGLSARALAGLCVDFSLARTGSVGATASDDVRFGFRLGGGLEYALTGPLWLYADAKWERYYGHSRGVSAWSSSLGGEIRPTDMLSVAAGIGVDF